MRLLAISGSVRQGSYNTALLRAAAECSPDVEFVAWDGLTEIPPYDEDVDSLQAPAPVALLRHEIQGSDAVLIATRIQRLDTRSPEERFRLGFAALCHKRTQEQASCRRRRQHRPVRRSAGTGRTPQSAHRDRRRRARRRAVGIQSP